MRCRAARVALGVVATVSLAVALNGLVGPLRAAASVSADEQELADALEAARVDVAAYRSMVATTADISPLTGAIDRSADRSLGAFSKQARLRELRAVSAQIRGPLTDVDIIVDPTIRVTAAVAALPLTVNNNTDTPLRAQLALRSDRVRVNSFANGESTMLWLTPGVNTYSFDTDARGSGRYTIDVDLRSPDGALLLATATIAVEPTAPSFLAFVLIGGAVGVLALWWLHDRARRRRDLAAQA